MDRAGPVSATSGLHPFRAVDLGRRLLSGPITQQRRSFSIRKAVWHSRPAPNREGNERLPRNTTSCEGRGQANNLWRNGTTVNAC